MPGEVVAGLLLSVYTSLPCLQEGELECKRQAVMAAACLGSLLWAGWALLPLHGCNLFLGCTSSFSGPDQASRASHAA